VIIGSGENRIEEFWYDGCLINAAMLELHKTLTPEIEKIVKERKVVRLDCLR